MTAFQDTKNLAIFHALDSIDIFLPPEIINIVGEYLIFPVVIDPLNDRAEWISFVSEKNTITTILNGSNCRHDKVEKVTRVIVFLYGHDFYRYRDICSPLKIPKNQICNQCRDIWADLDIQKFTATKRHEIRNDIWLL